MLRIPHPGARDPPLLQSQRSSSYIKPLASPVALLSLPRVRSVSKTLSGFELRTSQTTATPSWLATANFIPFAEYDVENEAGRGGDVC